MKFMKLLVLIAFCGAAGLANACDKQKVANLGPVDEVVAQNAIGTVFSGVNGAGTIGVGH